MDDSKLERRRSIRSLFSRKSGFGRRFESYTENSFRQNNVKAEAGLRRWSSHRSDRSGCSENTISQESSAGKSSKSSLVRSLSWIKSNFLSALSNSCNPSHPQSFKIFCSSLLNRKNEILICSEKFEPCVQSAVKIIQQQKSGFAFSKKKFDEMTAKERFQAELFGRPPVNCSEDGVIAEHCKDDKLCGEDDVEDCFSPTSDREDGVVAEHCEDDKLCGEDDDDVEDCSSHAGNNGGVSIAEHSEDDKSSGEEEDMEKGFYEQKGLRNWPTEEHVWCRKRKLRRFPPPLPSLARTGNLPCHMPWVHLRSYKKDGRLVIKEVKVQHHDFFKAERSNGRLIMHLVQHDEGKIRAHQAEKFKAKTHEAAIDACGQDYMDQIEEMGAQEVLDEAIDQPQLNNADKDNADAEEKYQKVNGDIEGQDKFSPNFNRGEMEAKLPDPVQVPVQQRFSPLGLGSPVGCCPPTPNPLFEIPLTAIRPILS